MTTPKPKKAKAAPPGAADATPLPIGRTRAAVLQHIGSLPPDERAKVRQDIKAHPDNAAKDKLEEYLVSAHFDPAVLQSETLANYVFLVREVLADFVPGMDLQQMLEPLQTLMSRYGGGRPKQAVVWAQWATMFEAKRKRNTLASAEQLYEFVADDWEADGHPPVSWRGVRNGISKLKKLKD